MFGITLYYLYYWWIIFVHITPATYVFSFFISFTSFSLLIVCIKGYCCTWWHSMTHTTLGRTPLYEGSARRRDLHLTTYNSNKRETAMPPAGFKPAILPSEPSQTHALDRAARSICRWNCCNKFCLLAKFIWRCKSTICYCTLYFFPLLLTRPVASSFKQWLQSSSTSINKSQTNVWIFHPLPVQSDSCNALAASCYVRHRMTLAADSHSGPIEKSISLWDMRLSQRCC
jgi:hypothetical protein